MKKSSHVFSLLIDLMCRLLTFRRCFSYSFCHYIEVVVASDVTRKLFQITWRWLPAAAAAAADIPSRLRCLVLPASLPRGCLASWTSSSACRGLWLRAQLQTKTPAQHQTSVCLSAGGCPAEIDNQTSSGRGSIAAAPAADYDVTWHHYVSQWCLKLLHTAASVYVESKLLSKPSSFTSFISQPSRDDWSTQWTRGTKKTRKLTFTRIAVYQLTHQTAQHDAYWYNLEMQIVVEQLSQRSV